MVLSDEDLLFPNFDVVWCGGDIRLDHRPGCSCFSEDDGPSIDWPATDEKERQEPDDEECPF